MHTDLDAKPACMEVYRNFYKSVHNISSQSVELWIQLRIHSHSGTLLHTFNAGSNKGRATQQHEHEQNRKFQSDKLFR